MGDHILYRKIMQKIVFDGTYFNPKDCLECGQIFRFYPYEKGYKVFSGSEACYVYSEANSTVFECKDADYFYNFFDLTRDYAQINERIKGYGVPVLTRAADICKGVRILNQNREETIFSFIISQNNNIPRIKGIIEKICRALGEKRIFLGEEYYTFPSAAVLAEQPPEFYKALGTGYRDVFLSQTAEKIAQNGITYLENLNTAELKKQLLTYKGIGPKVADCIALFGFHRTDSFPVDTWIEKLYREDFGGTLTNREKINAYFCGKFGEDSGLVQQYLFYAKRGNL